MTRQLRLTAIMAIVMTMLLPFQAWAENSGITIYVKGSTAPYIHIWECDDFETTWPGIQMTESTTINGEKFWYYTVTRNSLRFIIHNNNGSQSADLSADGDRYFDENWNDITDQMTAPASHTYTVAGNAGILNGKEWDPASETNRMTSTDGVTYTLEVKNAVLTTFNYQYKVCEDGNWSVMYPAGPNATLTIPADGTYDITYTYKVGDTEPSAEATPVGTGGGTETGISLVNGSTNAADRIYNLQGRQVKILTKGFYIKNNKKIIVK